MSLKLKNGKTCNVTYRISSDIAEILKDEAMERNISANALVNQILEKYFKSTSATN